MGFWSSLAGTVSIEITSASVEIALTVLNTYGIVLTNVRQINDLVTAAEVNRKDYRRVKKIAQKRGDEVRIVAKSGVYWHLKRLKYRPVLLLGMAVLFLLAVYLPTRVLFVTVQGNSEIPSQLIVEKAAQCGIGFGASRRSVRSEKMKNALLGTIPELQWAGINTYGCIAVISVNERSTPDIEDETKRVCSIVAARDGIIEELTVLRGTPFCKVGQAVKEGQLLVSAYTDCGLTIKAESAQAEVIASTMRTQRAVTLATAEKRGHVIREESYYSVKIGKNIIKLCKDSGISDPTCVKMYEQIPLLLPGGFQLPVSIIKEQIVYCEIQTVAESDLQTFAWLKDQSKAYLHSQMVAGEILHSLDAVDLQEEICCFDSVYACRELIGQILYERDFLKNG